MATTTCADCSAEVASGDVRYVNGRQVCPSCADAAGGPSAGPMGHWWTRILAAATVAAVVAAVGCPLVIRAVGVTSLFVVGAGGALIGLAVRLAAKNDAGFAERATAAGFALAAAVVGDYLLFALGSPGGLLGSDVGGWLDALVGFGGVGLLTRFGIGPLLAFGLSGARD